MNPIDYSREVPEKIEDMGIVFDQHTRQLIKFSHFLGAGAVAAHFQCTKGQLMKAVKRGNFPKPTKYGPGNAPLWADTIVSRVTRQDDEAA